MQVPEQILEFSLRVSSKVQEIIDLTSKYNDLCEKRAKILEISKEYLRVQPISDPEHVRLLLLMGIDAEMNVTGNRIRDKIDDMQNIASDFIKSS